MWEIGKEDYNFVVIEIKHIAKVLAAIKLLIRPICEFVGLLAGLILAKMLKTIISPNGMKPLFGRLLGNYLLSPITQLLMRTVSYFRACK